MDYEKKYGDLVEAVKELQEANPSDEGIQKWVEDNVPELAESEDERIRKGLLKMFNHYVRNNIELNEYGLDKDMVLAWLEKQGKQILANSAKTGKVEPKFKNGQWIVWQDKCYKVNYNSCGYELVDQNGLSTSLGYGTIDENAHLWDVTKDAKPGDVLVLNDEVFIYAHRKQLYDIAVAHCFVNSGGGFYFEGEFGYTERGNSIHPATKEQREQLEEAISDAGYTFDFEKKELKKIEQMPSWSEEDENFMYHTLSNLTELKDRYGEEYGNVGKCIKWLKSLKDRYAWKPSDEQMKALDWTLSLAMNCGEECSFDLRTLYEQLKKLKG